jgi:hypothetical protein
MKTKLIIAFLLLFMFNHTFSQNKKEQIIALNYRIDSLKQIINTNNTQIKNNSVFILDLESQILRQNSIIEENKLEAIKLKKTLSEKETEIIVLRDSIAGFNQKADLEKTFLEYLPDISGGRKLNNFIIKFGDLNGDGLIDSVVDYSLEPTWEDNGGGGNAISEISGIIIFVNSGNAFTIADHSDEFGGNFGSRNELKRIDNGVIFLEGLDYTDDDPRCCPTMMTTTKLILSNNKITKLK